MGVMDLLNAAPWLSGLLSNATGLAILQWVTVLTLVLGLAGWHTRIVLPLASIGFLVLGGVLRQYTHLFHTGLVPLYVLVVLCFTTSGDAWSLDRRRRIARGLPVVDRHARLPSYGWAQFSCWTAVAVCYLAAGMSKLRYGGLYWWDSLNVKNNLYTDTLGSLPFGWDLSLRIRLPDSVYAAMGLCALVVELGFIFVLVSRTARKALPLLAVLMHLGILAGQNVLFLDLILLQLIFYDWIPAGVRLGTLLRERPGGMTVTPASSSLHGVRDESRPDPRLASARHAPGRILPALIASAALIAWIFHVEYYPFTSWGMYAARDVSGVSEYYRFLARYDSGRELPLRLADLSAAFREQRDVDLAPRCLTTDPRDQLACTATLRTLASRFNRSHPDRIASIDIQKWRWNFRARPTDPNHGDVVMHTRVIVPSMLSGTGAEAKAWHD
jgi:hypothetical protein